jgi:hypothetical protein
MELVSPWRMDLLNDGWPAASVDDDALIDRDALCKLADRLAALADPNVHAVLVARNGKLLFERYFKGADEVADAIFGRLLPICYRSLPGLRPGHRPSSSPPTCQCPRLPAPARTGIPPFSSNLKADPSASARGLAARR